MGSRARSIKGVFKRGIRKEHGMKPLQNKKVDSVIELAQKTLEQCRWLVVVRLLKTPDKIKNISDDDLNYIYNSIAEYTKKATKKINNFRASLNFEGKTRDDMIDATSGFISNVISNTERFESNAVIPSIEECIALLSIYNSNTLDYEEVTKATIKEIEKHIKEVFKNYDTSKKETVIHYVTHYLISYYVSQLTSLVFTSIYKALHPEQATKYKKYIFKLEKEIQKEIKKHKKDYDKLNELFSNYLTYSNKMEEDIYRYADVFKIIERILTKLDKAKTKLNDPAPLKIPQTTYPDVFISPKDRVTNLLFKNGLSEKMQPIRTEGRKSEKQLTAVAKIEYDKLENVDISREMSVYDKQVYDAVTSLYIDGENRYITVLMVYRTMTGNPKAVLTDNIFEEVSDSLEKMATTRVCINAEKELEGYPLLDPIYKENLLYIRSIEGNYNGRKGEWIEILAPPILYRYANSKNQIARANIKVLNTPINKNKETIELQAYLYKRISDMKESNLSKSILYDTIYKQLNIIAKSHGALKKKQNKVRGQINRILDYWESIKFIKKYSIEPKGRKKYYRIKIHL